MTAQDANTLSYMAPPNNPGSRNPCPPCAAAHPEASGILPYPLYTPFPHNSFEERCTVSTWISQFESKEASEP